MNLSKRTIRVFAIVICFAVSFTCIPVLSGSAEAYAAGKTKKMTVYDQFLKKGNTLYVIVNDDYRNTQSSSVYKVDLRTSEATRLMYRQLGEGGGAFGMHLKNGYLYYLFTDDMYGELNRAKNSEKDNKRIARMGHERKYAISGSKIYYYAFKNYRSSVQKVMKLNGKSKRRVKGYKIKMIRKKSNVEGYSIVRRNRQDTYDYSTYDPELEAYEKVTTMDFYLRKPDGGEVFLGTGRFVRYEGLD